MNQLKTWYFARQRKEQALILVGALVLCFALLDRLVMAPLDRHQAKLVLETQKQTAATATLAEELANMSARDPRRMRDALARDYRQLRAELAAEEEAFDRARQGLVSAGQMTDVLARMVDLHAGLVLQEIENFPVEPLLANESGAVLDKAPVAAARQEQGGMEQPLYKHSVRMTLKGNYLDILRYLDTVERLPWRVSWNEMALETVEYPTSIVSLEFHTISTEDAWFKVS